MATTKNKKATSPRRRQVADQHIEFRATRAQRDAINAAAEAADMTIREWLMQAIEEHLKKVTPR